MGTDEDKFAKSNIIKLGTQDTGGIFGLGALMEKQLIIQVS